MSVTPEFESVVRCVSFENASIRTELNVDDEFFYVVLVDISHRDSGEEISIQLRWHLPPVSVTRSRERMIDWIYSCVRHAWVHELNESMFVDGKRRRDLHNEHGGTIHPPDEPPWLDPDHREED